MTTSVRHGRQTFVDERSYDGIAVTVEYNAPDNLDTGIPTTNGVDKIIDRPCFACGYSNRYKQPLWVQYRLTRKEATHLLGGEKYKRSNNFHVDHLLQMSATPDDYRASGYDRGHMAPAADMSWSADAMDDSFLMSNMSPQVPELNRGTWKDLEKWVRSEAQQHESLVVVSGPIFGAPEEHRVIGSGVGVPVAYFKVVLDESKQPRSIGFVIPNKTVTNAFCQFVCTVESVERLVHMSFFSKVHVDKSNKNILNLVNWSWPSNFVVSVSDAVNLVNGIPERKEIQFIDNMPTIVCPETNDNNEISCPECHDDNGVSYDPGSTVLPGSNFIYIGAMSAIN